MQEILWSQERCPTIFFFSGVFLFYIKIYYPVNFIVLKKKNLCNSHFYIVHMIYGFFDAYILLKLIPLLKPLHSLSFYFILEIECMYKWNHTNYDMTTLLKKSVIFNFIIKWSKFPNYLLLWNISQEYFQAGKQLALYV